MDNITFKCCMHGAACPFRCSHNAFFVTFYNLEIQKKTLLLGFGIEEVYYVFRLYIRLYQGTLLMQVLSRMANPNNCTC